MSGQSSQVVFSAEDFSDTFGREFNNLTDFFSVMNADESSSQVHVEGSSWSPEAGMYAVFDRAATGNIRINYFAILA